MLCALRTGKKKEQRLISKIRFTLETPALPMKSQAMGKIQNHWPEEQHSWGTCPQHSAQVTMKKSPSTIKRGRTARSSQISCITVSTSYWQLGIEHLLLHVILSCINLLEPGHLKHAVGCVSREARSHALEGTPSCFQPWSKCEHSLANTELTARAIYYRTM